MTLAEQVGTLRRTLYRLLSRQLSGRTRRPFNQLLAMKNIALSGVRTQAELAERLLMDPPAVSRLVDRLEEDGLVKRCAGEDRRCVRLEATDASRAELEVLKEEAARLDEDAARYLTPEEMTELKRLLEKVQAGLSQSHAAAQQPVEGESHG
ncbi:MarR family winged helix-turn-helix transcriptional regulator [Archangium lansingense]|uniref:MarR family transcriptional regulator n=1 Tax=Archangium lansingense TaxID=2995310 RepID=A0ABT4AA72_9BACT|nr:MarR family transcriptional regulator [Archangium lansinium]MCY1077842.1 MarR family transcriptional regulator [Archangium lansinium]